MSELIKRQDAINAVSRQYRYESDRMTALQNVAVVTEQEIRAKAIEEFAERLHELCGMEIGDCQYPDLLHESRIDEIAEQLKGGAE